MSNCKKISIITPSFNQGEFIEDTIKSVISQNYEKFEYIIIDGGSNDDTVDIIKRYQDKISYWISEPDYGQTNAINKGLKIATGDIITYLNSDDLFLPGTLEKIANYFNIYQDRYFVYGNTIVIDKKGEVIKYRKQLKFNKNIACMIGFGLVIDQPATFWRKEVFEKIGFFNENLYYTMDADYWFRISRYYKLYYINEYLAKFRWHSQSKTIISKNSNKKLKYELTSHRILTYNTLPISKYISFKYAKPLYLIYRFKRILLRFFKLHYFIKKSYL